MPSKVCSIEECEKKSVCRDMCDMHYSRWQRHGDPLKLVNPWGTPEERFWRFVNKETGTDCWHWTGYINSSGYGRFPAGKVPGQSWQAHRFSYELQVGPIPRGLFLMHMCDNPRCVNPAHLKPGTAKENTADMMAKGRGNWKGPRGERAPANVLTEAQAREIKFGTGRGIDLSARFGVNPSSISAIRTGRTWKHIT